MSTSNKYSCIYLKILYSSHWLTVEINYLYTKKWDMLKGPHIMSKHFTIFLLLFTLTIFTTVFDASPQEGCGTSECHVDMGKAKFLHRPVAAGECKVCHLVGKNDLPPDQHELSYPKEGRELCLDCHEQLEKFLKECSWIRSKRIYDVFDVSCLVFGRYILRIRHDRLPNTIHQIQNAFAKSCFINFLPCCEF